MKINEIYKTQVNRSSRIQATDLHEFEKEGLTVQDVKVVGTTRKGFELSFKETSLTHKCTRAEIFKLAKQLKTGDTNDFKNTTVYLEQNDKDIVRIKFK